MIAQILPFLDTVPENCQSILFLFQTRSQQALTSRRSDNKRLCKTMKSLSLPKDSALWSKAFTFGVATSSFQIEGAVNSRALSIWDTFCEKPEAIIDKSNGEHACLHYEKWQEDVKLVDSMGFQAYRLSISWPRIIKQDGSVNEDGINFYRNILSIYSSIIINY